MMKRIIGVVTFCMLFSALPAQDYTRYADPFVGTGGQGHTFPGALVPFGMIQLSPDTWREGTEGCSGYNYADTLICGFSHTHLSGTGNSDYGDILLVPTTGPVKFGHPNYITHYTHAHEKASPGYYAVLLDQRHIMVELSATPRTGIHQYTFPQSANANMILDLNHRNHITGSAIHIHGNNEITGYLFGNNWASHKKWFFVIQFSKPFKNYGISQGGWVSANRRSAQGRQLKSYVSFETTEGEVILVKVGISAVSIDGARKNLEAEQPGWDFNQVRQNAHDIWNHELSKISAESRDTAVMRTFYSSLYHVMTHPSLYQDVDGQYRGHDYKVHQANGYEQYTVFSIWDTYRGLHPLLALIDQKRTGDFIHSFLAMYEQGGLLPVWDLAGCETNCMTAYHSASVITDAYQKGIVNFNADEALTAMKKSAMAKRSTIMHDRKDRSSTSQLYSLYSYVAGWNDYNKYGYIRNHSGIQSVSKTLEYCYDDWCIAQLARKLNKPDDFNCYIKRAANYRNLFDTVTGFIRPRQKDFEPNFDPYAITNSYTEGNAWQYTFYVPHDISGHIQLLGGKERLAAQLDSLFTTTSELHGHWRPDVTGMVGQYAHGNEPSHQIAYEYDYAGQPWKTQFRTRYILQHLYRDQPNGLEGNDDCGQMGAWYVWSALGFYPVCPGSNQYAIGSPLMDKAVIHFESGKSFIIKTVNNSASNVYIASAKLNGLNYTKSYLNYEDMARGGEIEFTMDAVPNKNWGSAEGDVPVSKIEP